MGGFLVVANLFIRSVMEFVIQHVGCRSLITFLGLTADSCKAILVCLGLVRYFS